MTHVTPELPSTRLDVSDLIDQPGATRRVDLDVPAPDGFELPLTAITDDLLIDGVLESLVDGVLFRGTVRIPVSQQCARCLEPVPADTVTADVAELFSDPADVEDVTDIDPGYEISGDAIDVDTMLRDALAMAIPSAPLCRSTCQGLCPTCGVNRNRATCDCGEDIADDRWAALSDLKLNN